MKLIRWAIPAVCFVPVESERLETRLGPLAWRSSGRGPALVFFAGALANGDLWRDVVVALEDRYRCITIDLPLGAHPWPLSRGADRSATSLARLLLDCLELLDVEDATVVANDTAGGLLLLSLATGHPALGRVGRLVLTNCESYDQFPPDKLRKAAAVCRAFPRLARALLRLQLRSSAGRRRGASTVAASGLDDSRPSSPAPRWSPFPGPRRGSRSTVRPQWPTPSSSSRRPQRSNGVRRLVARSRLVVLPSYVVVDEQVPDEPLLGHPFEPPPPRRVGDVVGTGPEPSQGILGPVQGADAPPGRPAGPGSRPVCPPTRER